jgi:hypothetical protein
VAANTVRHLLTRHRQNYRRPIHAEGVVGKSTYPLESLRRRNSRRQRKEHAVYRTFTKQVEEPPQRCLGLASTRFSLQDHATRVGQHYIPLHSARRNTEKLLETWPSRADRDADRLNGQPHSGKHVASAPAGEG